jgi:hypothetical protein
MIFMKFNILFLFSLLSFAMVEAVGFEPITTHEANEPIGDAHITNEMGHPIDHDEKKQDKPLITPFPWKNVIIGSSISSVLLGTIMGCIPKKSPTKPNSKADESGSGNGNKSKTGESEGENGNKSKPIPFEKKEKIATPKLSPKPSSQSMSKRLSFNKNKLVPSAPMKKESMELEILSPLSDNSPDDPIVAPNFPKTIWEYDGMNKSEYGNFDNELISKNYHFFAVLKLNNIERISEFKLIHYKIEWDLLKNRGPKGNSSMDITHSLWLDERLPQEEKERHINELKDGIPFVKEFAEGYKTTSEVIIKSAHNHYNKYPTLTREFHPDLPMVQFLNQIKMNPCQNLFLKKENGRTSHECFHYDLSQVQNSLFPRIKSLYLKEDKGFNNKGFVDIRDLIVTLQAIDSKRNHSDDNKVEWWKE